MTGLNALRPLARRLRSAFRRLIGQRERAPDLQRGWDASWSRADFDAPWLGRGISPEIVAAVEDGWFRAGAPSIDLGCGQGDVVDWLAARDFPTLGVDIAAAAIAHARTRAPETRGRREFEVVDLCRAPPTARPRGGFVNLVDRGCLHQIPLELVADYGRSVLSACAADARMLLFCKAFRDPGRGDPAAEIARVRALVQATFNGAFVVTRLARTYLDRDHGRQPSTALPGVVLWLEQSTPLDPSP